MMDLITLNMDWRGKLVSVALGVQQIPSNRNSQVGGHIRVGSGLVVTNMFQQGIKLDLTPSQDNLSFKTKVMMQHMENGPVPDTAAFIQKMEEEKRKVEKGGVKDNRSFLAKYWMYIVPVVLFMAINGAASPEGGN